VPGKRPNSNSGLFGLYAFNSLKPPVLAVGCTRSRRFVKCRAGRIKLSRRDCSLLMFHVNKTEVSPNEAPSCFSKNLNSHLLPCVSFLQSHLPFVVLIISLLLLFFSLIPDIFLHSHSILLF